MPHPKVRTWTLGTLDRDRVYVLFFDPEAFRWEVRPYGSTEGTLTTRPSGREKRRAQAAGGTAARLPRDGATGAAR
jgi:hypothetical protein